MKEIIIFAKQQTIDVEIAPSERNRHGKIITDNSDHKYQRYEWSDNAVMYVTLYQTTLSAAVPFKVAYEIIRNLIDEWGMKNYVDVKLLRDIGSVWSFYLTLWAEDIVDNYIFKTDIECEVISSEEE